MTHHEFEFEVTRSDIDSGVRRNYANCLVSTAIGRGLPDGATRIEVTAQTIRFTLNKERLVYQTPDEVKGYVVAFDAGGKIEPFKFTIKDPIVGKAGTGRRKARRLILKPANAPGPATQTRAYGERILRKNSEGS